MVARDWRMMGTILQNPADLSREGHMLSSEMRHQMAVRNVINMPEVLATSVGNCCADTIPNQLSLRASRYALAASSAIFRVFCEARSKMSVAGSFQAPLAILRDTSDKPLTSVVLASMHALRNSTVAWMSSVWSLSHSLALAVCMA